MAAIWDLTKRPYLKLIIPKSITGTYFDTKLSKFG